MPVRQQQRAGHIRISSAHAKKLLPRFDSKHLTDVACLYRLCRQSQEDGLHSGSRTREDRRGSLHRRLLGRCTATAGCMLCSQHGKYTAGGLCACKVWICHEFQLRLACVPAAKTQTSAGVCTSSQDPEKLVRQQSRHSKACAPAVKTQKSLCTSSQGVITPG